MKTVFCAAIILIIFGAALTLYLRSADTRFVESLPKVPSPTSLEQSTDPIAPENTSENEKIKRPTAANSLQATTVDDPLLLDIAPRPLHHSDSHFSEGGSTFSIQRESIVLHHEQDDDDDIEAEDESPPTSVTDLSLEEIIEVNRQYLIREHGDIPEIDRFLELSRPFFQQIQEGATEIVVELTPEESLENSRLTALFYPTEANRKAYLDELEKMKELGVIK